MAKPYTALGGPSKAPQLRDLTKYVCRNGTVYWRVNANDARLELTTKELQDQGRFNEVLVRAELSSAAQSCSSHRCPGKWHATLGSLVSEMRTVNQ